MEVGITQGLVQTGSDRLAVKRERQADGRGEDMRQMCQEAWYPPGRKENGLGFSGAWFSCVLITLR